MEPGDLSAAPYQSRFGWGVLDRSGGLLEDRWGVFAAAALVFLAGTAGTGGVSGYRVRLILIFTKRSRFFGGGWFRLRVFHFGEWGVVPGDEGFDFQHGGAGILHFVVGDVFADGADFGEAEFAGVVARDEVVDAELAFGLEAAEFGHGEAELAAGLGAGAVEGELGVEVGGFGAHGVEDVGVG